MDFWDLFFLFLIYIPLTVLWISTVFDAVGRVDLSGVAKCLWVLGILLFPLGGALAYLITRPSSMELEVRRREKEAVLRSRLDELEARPT